MSLDTMTWRRFLVLLRGLGPNSATLTMLGQRNQDGDNAVRVVDTPEAAQAAFLAIAGH